MSKALVLFAEGFENCEALMVVDIFRRGKVETTMASITEDEQVRASNGVLVEMDTTLGEIDLMDYDIVVLPGGLPGTEYLEESAAVKKTVLAMNEEKKIVAAICAAPRVLAKNGLLDGKKACCYPGQEENFPSDANIEVVTDPVVVEGNIVTSRGLGTVEQFAFTLLGMLEGEEVANTIKQKIVYQERK